MILVWALLYMGLAAILQSTVVARIQIFSGFADLPLLVLAAWTLRAEERSTWVWALTGGLFVAYLSGLPAFIPMLSYVFVAWFGLLARNLVWKTQLLLMLTIAFAGTLVSQAMQYVTLLVLGTPLPFGDVLQLIFLPSVLMNMIFAIPVHIALRDLAFSLGQAYREDAL